MRHIPDELARELDAFAANDDLPDEGKRAHTDRARANAAREVETLIESAATFGEAMPERNRSRFRRYLPVQQGQGQASHPHPQQDFTTGSFFMPLPPERGV